MLSTFRAFFRGFGIILSLLTLLALSAQSCSRIKMGYGYVDDILKKAARDSLKLNEQQRKQIDQEIDVFMAWHREQMLPVYVAFLDNGVKMLRSSDALDRKTFDLKSVELEKIIDDSIKPAIKPLSELLITLDESQLKKLDETLKESNQRYEKTFVGDAKKRDENTANAIIGFWKSWLVGLNKQQEQVVREHVSKLSAVSLPWMDFRRAHQAELLERLRKKQKAAEIQKYLEAWILAPAPMQSKAMQENMRQTRAVVSDMSFQLFTSLNVKQRQRLADRLQGFSKDFRSLYEDRKKKK